MKIRVTPTALDGVVLVDIDYFRDERGFFIEPWNRRHFAEAGLDIEFVQEGHSRSAGKVLRGLHYQDMTAPMGKLVRCTVGKLLDVVVDLRMSSPTFGKWISVELDSESQRQIYVPPGFAHGFATLSEVVEIQYKQTGFYTPAAEGGVRWNDPDIGVEWPYSDPVLSKRDANSQSLKDYLKNPAFR